MVQRPSKPSAAYYLGKGKLKELASLKEATGYDVVIFDDELSPTQQRNVEKALQVKVIDRTALILDIFARHARTKEGQLQVELAQHQYFLPRLPGQWTHLERLGGGIGTRGPGERQIETDRRLIRQRIHRLNGEIEHVRRHRALYRRYRRRRGIPVVSLIGYTNAGKSTLLNTLSGANALVEDKLFTTLDPITRRIRLPDGKEVLLTDTVGFIQKLPTTIIAAFRATLEELSEADLLLHIVDITQERKRSQIVEEILKGLGLSQKPRITVLNKIDLIEDTQPVPLNGETPVVLISAAKGWGFDHLLGVIEEALGSDIKFSPLPY